VPDSETPHTNAIHLHPTAPLAERVLLPGDPGRALALAQSLLSEPRMFNHNRGLWGYTGEASDGEQLTIQATGMGGPSAAIVLAELIELGARRAIRVGTCGALSSSLALGDLVIARDSVCADGTSRAIARRTRARAGEAVAERTVVERAGAEHTVIERAAADRALTQALLRSAPSAHAGTIVSVDLFYDDGTRGEDVDDALAVEMEAATLFALGAAAGVPVGCVLMVTDTFDARGARTRIDDHALRAAAERMGVVALAALAG
jgi:uridine phosphorylase